MLKKIAALLIFPIIFLSLFACSVFRGEESQFPEASGHMIIFMSDRVKPERPYFLWSGNSSTVYQVEINGLPEPALIGSMAWSEQAERLFFSARIVADSDIYSMNLDGSDLINLTETMNRYEENPVPSPDGNSVVFEALELDVDIMIMNLDGSDIKNLTAHPARDFNPIWSSDGNRILYNSNREGTPNIYTMNINGTENLNLSKGKGQDSAHSISSGGIIFFQSDRDGNMDIFSMNESGENIRNLSNSPARETEPIISPDGKWIIYRSNRDNGSDIYLLNVESGETSALTRTPEFREFAVSWTPDSSGIIFSTKDAGVLDLYHLTIGDKSIRNITSSSFNDYAPLLIGNDD